MHAPKRMSVFTATALGLSAVIITCVVSASIITLYGMRIIDKKADTLVGTVQVLIEQLPALKAALPPALADAISDERRPDYADRLDIEASVRPHAGRSNRAETSISIANQGDEVISTLALRVVVLDEDGRPISGGAEYVATPLAIDNDWRGPLMPGSKRRIARTHYCPRKAASVEYEITELRIWRPEQAATASVEPASADELIETAELAANTH